MKYIDFHKNVLLLVTEKADGNMGPKMGSKAKIKKNREKIYEELEIKANDIIEAQQIHDTIMLVLIPENTKMWRGDNVAGIDAMMTDITRPYMMVKTADCVPVVLYDPEKPALAIAHIGWKNATMDMTTKLVERLTREYESDPKKLLAWIGPSIQKESYAFKDKPKQADDEEWQDFIEKKGSKYHIDLPGFVRKQLMKSGLYAKNITWDETDTYTSDNYFSYRKGIDDEAASKGNIAIIAKLKEA